MKSDLGEQIVPAILSVRKVRFLCCVVLPLTFVLCIGEHLQAQLPFYTDDTAVTEPRKSHLEFFNEYDGLQLLPTRSEAIASEDGSFLTCEATVSLARCIT